MYSFLIRFPVNKEVNCERGAFSSEKEWTRGVGYAFPVWLVFYDPVSKFPVLYMFVNGSGCGFFLEIG